VVPAGTPGPRRSPPSATSSEAAPADPPIADGQVWEGTLPDIEGEPIATGGCDSALDERLGTALGSPEGLRVNPTLSVTVGVRQGERRTGSARPDAVKEAIGLTSKLTEDASAPGSGEFGVEKVTYKITDITFKHDPKAAVVDVGAKVFSTSSGACTPSAVRTSPAGPTPP
jgi:hypothetical protein